MRMRAGGALGMGGRPGLPSQPLIRSAGLFNPCGVQQLEHGGRIRG